MGNGKGFQLKSGNGPNGPYSSQKEATDQGITTPGKDLINQGYKTEGDLQVGDHTVSQDYSRTTKATRPVEEMAKSNEDYLKSFNNKTDIAKAKAQGWDISDPAQLNKYITWKGGELGYRDKKEDKTLSATWGDTPDPYKPGGEEVPPAIDPSGFTAEGISTDAINTKLGDIDGKLQGKGSRLTKRVEESTDLAAEGFGSKGTPLKTRGIANKNWGLA
jgi:hypothetical protein